MYPQTDAARVALPLLGTTDLHAGIVLALLAAFAAGGSSTGPKEGLRLRAIGFNANAAAHGPVST